MFYPIFSSSELPKPARRLYGISFGNTPTFSCREMKEPWFLSHDDRFEGLGWDWYNSLFLPGSEMAAVGEASSCYCVTRLYPNALRRLGNYFPDARLIYCVREPYARIESAWKQCLSTRHPMPREFSAAVQTYPPLLEGSRYGESLRAYLDVFPRKHMHIVLFDELAREPLKAYARCLEFLGVDPTFSPNDIREAKNRSTNKSIDTRAYRVLKQSWLGRLGRRVAPPIVKGLATAFLREPMPEAVWTPNLREWVRKSLGDDTQEFLELAGLERTLWAASFGPVTSAFNVCALACASAPGPAGFGRQSVHFTSRIVFDR